MKTFGLMALVVILIIFLAAKHFLYSFSYDTTVLRFKNTKAWPLVKAVYKEDLITIEKILNKDASLVNFKEPEFGETLLMLCVQLDLKKSARLLLAKGADPNLADDYDGENAVIKSSGYGRDFDVNTGMLELLLDNGGDPNSEEVGVRREGNWTRNTPLQKAAGCSLEKVKLLLEAGADMNYKNEFNGSAINSALTRKNKASAKVIIYLLDQGIDIDQPVRITSDGKPMYIENELRYWNFPIDSEEHQLKKQIIKSLEEKGKYYANTPIPEKYYDRYSQEYLDQY